MFSPDRKLPLLEGKPKIIVNSDKKDQKRYQLRMFKDSEDLHGLQTANSKNLGWYIDTTGLSQSNKAEKWHFSH